MKKILVIDDDKDILEVVEIILASHGFEVRTDTDGSNVDELIIDFKPDLILLGYQIIR